MQTLSHHYKNGRQLSPSEPSAIMMDSEPVGPRDAAGGGKPLLHSPLNTTAINLSYSDLTHCADISSPQKSRRKFHLKPKLKPIQSTPVVPPPIHSSPAKSTAKLENLASILVKNIFNKRLMMNKKSSMDLKSDTSTNTLKSNVHHDTFQRDEMNNESSSPTQSQHLYLNAADADDSGNVPKSPFPELQLSASSSSEMMISPPFELRLSSQALHARNEESFYVEDSWKNSHVDPFPNTLLSSDIAHPDNDRIFRPLDTSSPMRRRIRKNLDALYSLYACSRNHPHFETNSFVGSDEDDNLWKNDDTHHPDLSSSCTYNFLPLSWLTACTSDGLKSVDMNTEFNVQMKRVLSSESVCTDYLHLPVLLHSTKELDIFPSILSDDQILQLRNDGVPPTVKLMSWIRAYSLRRDGDCFDSMVQKLVNCTQTLVVIQTTHEDILGGYSDIPWIRSTGGDYCGGGRVFLFASNPATNDAVTTDKKSKPLHLYHWNGKKNTLQMSSMNRGCFGMGDGDGAFGWFIQSNFTSGITGPCESFQAVDGSPSPALTNDSDGIFGVKDIEVWGFLPMLTSFHQSRYQLLNGLNLKRSPYFSPSEVSMPLQHR